MEPLLAAAAGFLDAIGIGPWAHGSVLVYPVANVIHLLGLVMLVGGIGIVDLRVAGLWRSLPLEPLSRALTPVAIAGLLLMLPSGVILFAADGKALAGSDVFMLKLALVAAALVNAFMFRRLWSKSLRHSPPLLARVSALLSLGLWLTIGAMGRWIAYS